MAVPQEPPVYAELLLANDAIPGLEAIRATAFVNTNAQHLCLPEQVARQLQLKDTDVREIIGANGHVQQVRYVSPVRIGLLGRTCVTGALVLGDQVLLGAIQI